MYYFSKRMVIFDIDENAEHGLVGAHLFPALRKQSVWPLVTLPQKKQIALF